MHAQSADLICIRLHTPASLGVLTVATNFVIICCERLFAWMTNFAVLSARARRYADAIGQTETTR